MVDVVSGAALTMTEARAMTGARGIGVGRRDRHGDVEGLVDGGPVEAADEKIGGKEAP
jgi:hypothetical protein